MSRPIFNSPKLWQKKLPRLTADGNKYTRGHAVIIGGNIERNGAARLAAVAALRSGAGVVTVACEKEAAPVYAAQLTAVMLKIIGPDFTEFLKDERKTAFLIGPGSGLRKATRERTLKLLKLNKNLVIDADAITIFQNKPKELFTAIKNSKGQVILTPHAGEFARIFHLKGNRQVQVQAAAKLSGAVVLLKGNQTLIAAPNSQLIVSNNGSPSLATAGSGDVLAGIIAGFLAQNMPTFLAAAAGAWIHGEAAHSFSRRFGKKRDSAAYGLISEDLLYLLPDVLNQVYQT